LAPPSLRSSPEVLVVALNGTPAFGVRFSRMNSDRVIEICHQGGKEFAMAKLAA
jgi:hypothetical protein